MKRITILGSTGSIGRQTFKVIRKLKKDFKVVGLSANSNLPKLKSQIKEFHPEIAAILSKDAGIELKDWCRKNKLKTRVTDGLEGLVELSKYNSDILLSAVVGSVGLEPLISAIRTGKDIALANKESLVIAGKLIMAEARKHDVKILPVDSEHSAIFQCLKDEGLKKIKRIILTASGGPFYNYNRKHSTINVTQALDHPTWKMGPKITIDSATLMNKGLEAIEAHHLFNVPMDKIDIVIHPQSIVHSMVEFVDGSTLAQMSHPNMELPIQYALTYPQRYVSNLKKLNLTDVEKLEFYKPDFNKFRCLKLALEAGRAGGTMPVVMNAANEIAVGLFLNKKIKFTKIASIIDKVMSKHRSIKNPTLKQILQVDMQAKKDAGLLC
ncbi:MAG: 1-deoxy-D-xylulose-5-phosphate reductoisomerase [Endomicrobiales bacterium]|nr:1-deoxy-D-xylulose-5-phosphate reductoisomerase [Endomicrobiales bacterium]